MELNKIGELAETTWLNIPEYFKDVKLDEYNLLPNHLHAFGRGEASPDNRSGSMLDWSGDASP